MELDDCIIELDDSVDAEFSCYSPEQQARPPLAKRRKKPSVTSSWSYSDINHLIMAVEEHSCVWEYSCPEYKDRYKRDQAWREIVTRCPGHTVDDCKGKWANVKTAFQNVRKKHKAKSGQGAKNIQPHWPHWNAMQFYNRHSTSTVDTHESHPGTSSPQISSHTETANSSHPTTATSSYTQTAMREKDDILQRAMKCLQTEEDNWHAIGMYLASQMREIAKKNKKTANKLHLQLIKVVMEATLKAEEED